MKLTVASRKRIEATTFILPGFLFVLIVLGYPLIYNLILSFQDVTVQNFGRSADFVGFSNYVTLFNDKTFMKVFGNTFVFTIGSVFFQFTLGTLLALLFCKKFRMGPALRGLSMIPYMTPMAVTGLLWKNMFSTSFGVINDLLMKLGLIHTGIDWLTDQSLALTAVIIANCWVGIPFNMLLITTGLTSVPNEVYESASVDGANAWVRFWRITVPMIRPAMFAVLMLGCIYTFKCFDLMYIMTGGGPLNSTDVLSTYSYTLSFSQYQFSLGSAVAVVLFVCLLLVAFVYLKMLNTEDD